MKRLLTTSLALLLVFTLCNETAAALETYASFTLMGYSARLSAGNSSGSLIISYDVRASKQADSVGVSKITLYDSNNNFITTISDSTDNGLICEKSSINKGTYTHTLTSGISYYAEVTVFATVGNTTDQRVVTTKAVVAP